MSATTISMVFSSLSHPPLSSHAADCILEIVNKGMDEDEKLAILQQLDIMNQLSKLSSCTLQLQVKISEICNAMGLQILQFFDKCSTPTAINLLEQTMPILMRCYESELPVSFECFPFVTRLIVTIDKQQQQVSAKWLQTATSTTKLTHPILLTRRSAQRGSPIWPTTSLSSFKSRTRKSSIRRTTTLISS